MPRWDVIVIGAGLGGMLTAALLARRGRRVLVLESAAQPGGRLRSYDLDGFVVDCGAFLWPNKFLDEALAAAAVTDFVGSQVPLNEVMRIYVQGVQGRRFAFPWLGRDAGALADTVREVYRITADQFHALGVTLGKLTQLDDSQVAALLRVTVRDWLASNAVSPQLGDAFCRTLMLFGSRDPPNASLGEFVRLLQRNRAGGTAGRPECCGPNPGGGVRALVTALRAALERNGAELRLATRVEQIAVTNGCARGVLAHTGGPFQERYDADILISNVPIWTLFDILAARHFPEPFVANARHYARVGGTISVAYAFNELPALRETTEPDRFRGWTRLLVGPDRGFGGGFLWTSHHSPDNAPAGKHILQGMRLVAPETLSDHEAVAQVVAAFDAMVREIYRDTDRTLRWSRHWVTRDGTEYMISAVSRPDVRAPHVGNLYFVGETTNVPSIQMDAAALSALECVRLIEERG